MAAKPVAGLELERSVLVVVDVQARLAPHVLGGEGVERRCGVLVQGANALGVPAFLTEHCPEALGHTVPSIGVLVSAERTIAKRHFSAMKEMSLPKALRETGRDQVLVAGMEAHVCVMQTALGILAAGYECWIAADAVGSRRPEDRAIALERMRASGAHAASAEMVLFEWLGSADHPAFRTLLQLVKTY